MNDILKSKQNSEQKLDEALNSKEKIIANYENNQKILTKKISDLETQIEKLN